MAVAPPPFVVDPTLVAKIKNLIMNTVAHSEHTTFSVRGSEFAAWLVALGRESFYAHTMQNGQRFIRAGYATVGEPNDPHAPIVSVTCGELPADWITFPESQGDRRFMFRYTTNPLSTNETESQ